MSTSRRKRAIPVYEAYLLKGTLRTLEVRRTLNERQRAYLIQAIKKLLTGVPADMAFTPLGVGRPNERISKKSLRIYDRVLELRGEGLAKQDAYRRVQKEEAKHKEDGRSPLTVGGIEKRFTRTAKVFGQN